MGPFLGGLVFFSFIFLMFQALRLAEFFIVHGVAFGVIMKLVGLMLISVLPFTIAISFLIGVLVALRRLCTDGEWTAMGACGYGIRRLSRSLVVASVFVSALTLGLSLEWTPNGEKAIKGLIVKIGNTKISASLQAGAFTFGFFDLLIYADQVNAKGNQLKNVFIFDERRPNDPVAVVAKTGSIVPIQSERDLDVAHVLQLRDGNIHRNARETGAYQRVNFNEYNLFLMIHEGVNVAANTPKMKGIQQILADMKTYKDRPDMMAEFDAELWRRIAMGLSPMAFLIVGLGFGVIRNRSAKANATMVAFGCMIFYLLAESFAASWVMQDKLPGWFGMMIPNFCMIIFGLFAAYRSKST